MFLLHSANSSLPSWVQVKIKIELHPVRMKEIKSKVVFLLRQLNFPPFFLQFRCSTVKNLLAMLSCGETILASNAEVDEFYELARVLGMDKENGERLVDHRSEQPQLPNGGQEEVCETVDLTDQEVEDNYEEIYVTDAQESIYEEEGRKEEEKTITGSQDLDHAIREEMSNKLKDIITSQRDPTTRMFKCPQAGCEITRKDIHAVLYHLCATHFKAGVMERRKEELGRASTSRNKKCEACGSVQSSPFNLISHYGVVHKDVALVALERGILEANNKRQQQQGRQDNSALHNIDHSNVKEPKQQVTDDGNGLAQQEEDRMGVLYTGVKRQQAKKLKKLCRSSGGFSCFLCCQGNFQYFSGLLRHLSQTHFRRKLEKNLCQQLQSDASSQCSECPASLASKRSLVEHYGVVHGHALSMALKVHKQQAESEMGKGHVFQSIDTTLLHDKVKKKAPTYHRQKTGQRDEAKLKKFKSFFSQTGGNKEGVPCPFCPQVSKGFAILLQHMTLNHFRSEVIHKRPDAKVVSLPAGADKDDPRFFCCLVCPSRFTSSSLLVCHYGSVHGDVLDPALEALEARGANGGQNAVRGTEKTST